MHKKSIYDGKWLYYCYLSPIWRTRIDLFGGKLNQRTKQIEFMDEKEEEEFYGKYNYEPDNNKNLVDFVVGSTVC